MNTVIVDIAEIIEDMVNQYVPDVNNSCEDINTGNCERFAIDVVSELGDGVTRWGGELDFVHWGPNITEEMWNSYYRDQIAYGHCFIIYEEEYYDSETPKGVEWPDELPCFVRMNAGRR